MRMPVVQGMAGMCWNMAIIIIAHGQWTLNEMVKSSTWRELTSVVRILRAVARKLANYRVR